MAPVDLPRVHGVAGQSAIDTRNVPLRRKVLMPERWRFPARTSTPGIHCSGTQRSLCRHKAPLGAGQHLRESKETGLLPHAGRPAVSETWNTQPRRPPVPVFTGLQQGPGVSVHNVVHKLRATSTAFPTRCPPFRPQGCLRTVGEPAHTVDEASDLHICNSRLTAGVA